MRFSSLLRPALGAGALVAAVACNTDKKPADVLAQDSTLTRDLAMANQDTNAQPQLRDVPNPSQTSSPRLSPPAPLPRRVPPRPRPVTPAQQPRAAVSAPQPTPPPPPPRPVTTPSGNTVTEIPRGNSEERLGTIAAGTTLALAAGQRVCTNTNTPGDRFTATLAEAVTASNGVVLPAGATAVLEVAGVKRSEQAGDNMSITVAVRSISYGGKSYPVDGEITSAQTEKVKAAGNNDAGKVLGGAAIGAVLGRVLSGRSKTRGTIIGAAGGAAAGAVLAHQTAKFDACIPSGGRITVRLDQPLQVQAMPSSGGDGI